MTLTQQRAQKRFSCIKQGSIFYDFHVSLEIGNYYNGLSQITFELNNIPQQLQLDFASTNIKKYVINGQICEPKTLEGVLEVDVTKIKLNQKNIISVLYRNTYDNDGSGCVSFTDVDGKQYLYTQFEPYYANRVFALFDQPDLKAKMRLSVISPKQWKKVLSNEYPFCEKNFNKQQYLNSIKSENLDFVKEFLEDANEQKRMTLFDQSKLLPTYLYCFIAGDYQELKNQNPYNGIPMSLYCIQSLFKYMKEMAPFVFEITIQSLKFFQEFFGYKYSFNKYDQVFAHQYKYGAMQNAGIVTHNDRYIWKDAVSTQTKLDFANTISHQLAHHWFGNLVTMKWWDDLWLNESFADFISYFCLQKIKDNCQTIKYQSAMASFLTRKGWGYHEDQMITTHPIRGPVANTLVAESIFDGITYSKGASTMKQLTFLMSEGKFSSALKQYFHKYEWKNATLDDFINVMENHFSTKQFTLHQWRQLWLQKACCNKLQAVWNPQDKCLHSKIQIKQSHVLEDHKTLRMHRIKVGLVKQNGEIDPIQVLIKPQQKNYASYDGSKNYKAILLNYQDHSFVKNVIDKVSLQYFSNNLNQIKDLLSRTLIWRTYYDMVKDGQIKSSQYLKIVVKFLAKQTSDSIFQTQLDYLYNSINIYTPIKIRQELNQQVFLFIFNLLQNQSQNLAENRIVILKQKLIRFAYSHASKRIVLSWLKNQNQHLKKHQMTVDNKWSALIKIFTLNDLPEQQKWSLFEKQQKQDPTDTAKNHRYLCKALIASKQQFQNIYNQFKDKDLSVSVKEYLASGWKNRTHSDWLLQYRDRYFADILPLTAVLQGDHFSFFYENLQPIDDDLQYHIQKYQPIKLLENGKYDKDIREIMKIVDQLKRRIKTYNLYQS